MPKLKNAPVFLTAAQVTHNPVLALESFLPNLQERFRALGFPDYQLRQQQRFALSSELGDELQVKVDVSKQYAFSNFERTACFIVEPARIFFCVTNYDVFTVFRQQFIDGLELVHSVIKLDYFENVSMRMLDAIVPDSRNLGFFLVPELLGLPNRIAEPSWSVLHSGQESAFRSKSHQLKARTFIHNGRLALPPDIQMIKLALLPKFNGVDAVHAVLDSDATLQCREPFDVQKIGNSLLGLKNDLKLLFDISVTDAAKEEWNK